MDGSRLRDYFVLIHLLSLTQLEAHNHEEFNSLKTIGENNPANGRFTEITCISDKDCSAFSSNSHQTNSTLIQAICDTATNFCKCPVIYEKTKVVQWNNSCILSMQLGEDCLTDFDCGISGAHCSPSAELSKSSCQCLHNFRQVKNSQICSYEEYSGSSEFSTLKWLFLFILIGYPVITLLFAIFGNLDDSWVMIQLASIGKRKSPKNRNRRNRRNTDEDLVSTDDESPLEMETV